MTKPKRLLIFIMLLDPMYTGSGLIRSEYLDNNLKVVAETTYKLRRQCELYRER